MFSKVETGTWIPGNTEVVSLPHTGNAFDGQVGGNDYYRGIYWNQRLNCVTKYITTVKKERK